MPKALIQGTPEAIERRQLRVNIEGLTDTQRRHRAGVIGLGQTAYGPRWRSDLAKSIATEMGRPVSQAQVAHWISGTRPVPEAVYEACLKLSDWQASDLRRRASILASRSWTDSREWDDGTVAVPEAPETSSADAALERAARIKEE